jgi:hypothetical protein
MIHEPGIVFMGAGMFWLHPLQATTNGNKPGDGAWNILRQYRRIEGEYVYRLISNRMNKNGARISIRRKLTLFTRR